MSPRQISHVDLECPSLRPRQTRHKIQSAESANQSLQRTASYRGGEIWNLRLVSNCMRQALCPCVPCSMETSLVALFQSRRRGDQPFHITREAHPSVSTAVSGRAGQVSEQVLFTRQGGLTPQPPCISHSPTTHIQP